MNCIRVNHVTYFLERFYSALIISFVSGKNEEEDTVIPFGWFPPQTGSYVVNPETRPEPKPEVPLGSLQPLLPSSNFIVRKGDNSQHMGTDTYCTDMDYTRDT